MSHSARADKYPDKLKDLTKNFKVVEERRSTVRTKLKDDLAAVEEARKKEQQQRTKEDVPVLPRRREKDLKCSLQKIGKET